MHKYLRAIGFSKLNKSSELEALMQEVITGYDRKSIVEMPMGRRFAEISKEFAPDCGICICGEYNDNDEFHLDNYFPYLNGEQISTSEDVVIERHSDKESYIGACDDMRLEISLIFHLINVAEYLKLGRNEGEEQKTSSVALSALSIEGKILLPVFKSADYAKEKQKRVQKRNAMIMAARNGDEEAIESLTVEDMDIYNEISKRAQNEDIYSIVDNCFMPFGFGTDIYSIVADITDCEFIKNEMTGEELYRLSLTCNQISIDVCINSADLDGTPQVGRRFKGIIWLQGNVSF